MSAPFIVFTAMKGTASQDLDERLRGIGADASDRAYFIDIVRRACAGLDKRLEDTTVKKVEKRAVNVVIVLGLVATKYPMTQTARSIHGDLINMPACSYDSEKQEMRISICDRLYADKVAVKEEPVHVPSARGAARTQIGARGLAYNPLAALQQAYEDEDDLEAPSYASSGGPAAPTHRQETSVLPISAARAKLMKPYKSSEGMGNSAPLKRPRGGFGQ